MEKSWSLIIKLGVSLLSTGTPNWKYEDIEMKLEIPEVKVTFIFFPFVNIFFLKVKYKKRHPYNRS